MRRLIIALAVVLVAAIAAAPFATGYVMESTLADAGNFPGTRDALDLEVTDYQRGYLASQATSELVVRMPDEELVRIKLAHRIDQMPGLDGRYATVHTRWEPKDPEIRKQLVEVFGEDEPFELTTALYVNGASHSTGRIPAVEQEGVAFTGADVMLDTHADGRFDYRVESERLAVDDRAEGVDAGSGVTAEGLRIIASGRVAEDGFVWDSEARAEMDRMDVRERDGGGHMEDLAVSVDSTREDDLWGFAVGYQLGKAAIEGQKFRDAELRVAVERLDAEAVRKMVRRLEDLQELAAQGVDIEQAVGEAVMEELPAMIARGPRIAIESLKATTVEGRTDMTLAATLPGDVIQGEPNPMMWMAMLSALVVEGRFEMPMALLEKQTAATGQNVSVQKQLAPLVSQGWVEIQDGVVRSTLDYRQGNLKLNGTSANQLLNSYFGG
jgi:uncharacterized protein YdgA (DUF945 family)